MRIEEGDWKTYYPLHPKNVEEIENDSKVFDSIEARIAAYPDIEFEIVVDTKINMVTKYAKLIDQVDKEKQKERLIQLMELDAKDGLYQMEISDEEIDNAVVIEYENVGDEKLFPNHTDKDIWMNGFYDGARWYREQLKQRK